MVAHPPCARWCQLAGLVESLYPERRRGEDGGTFAAALEAVRCWGGVLEHPAYTAAWPAYGLLAPQRGCWSRSLLDEGWVTEVSQSAYGHRARKRTWLYFVGKGTEPPSLDWSEPEHSLRVSNFETWGNGPMPDRQRGSVTAGCAAWMSPRERKATPLAFRDMLLDLARSVVAAGESRR